MERPYESIDIQIEDVLVRLDKIVTLAISRSIGGIESGEYVTARMLDDSLFELRVWVENIKAASQIGNLKGLDALEGSTAQDLHKVIRYLHTLLDTFSSHLNNINP